MDSIVLQPTDSTPEVAFYKDGRMLLKGRSLPEDVVRFYAPLVDWISELNIEKITFDVKFEYLNTASTKQVFQIFQALELNTHIKSVEVNWFYEYDDLEMEDMGEVFEADLKKSKFQYVECMDIFG